MVASELTQAAKSELVQQQQQQQPPRQPVAESSGRAATSLRNRAEQSISPYVQSHATSPVAWQILDDETLQRARTENKLIFLNVGFKACHCENQRPSLPLPSSSLVC